MASDTLDRLLCSLSVRLHAASVCLIQDGWQLAYAPFEAVTVHYVLRGSGVLRVGTGPWLRFAPFNAVVVPARQTHVMGAAGAGAVVRADDHCSLLADGLVAFTAGDGRGDIVLLCGMIPAAHGHALGLLELLREPMIEDFADNAAVRQVFDLMRAEVATPGLGTQAMAEVLMKQCLIALLRQHLLREGEGSPVSAPLQHPRLARAVLAVIENPAATHSVGSLAAVAGMSRASFAEHFARAFDLPPIEFVQSVRLRVAARLLVTTDLPVKVIAQSVGYTAPAAFSRAFRGIYQIDPIAYRMAAVEGPGRPEQASAAHGNRGVGAAIR